MIICNQQNRPYAKTLKNGVGVYLNPYTSSMEIDKDQITPAIEKDAESGLIILQESE